MYCKLKKIASILCLFMLCFCNSKGIYYYHFSGGEIRHIWLSDSTYAIRLVWYENCIYNGASPMWPYTNMCYTDTCGFYTTPYLSTTITSTVTLPDGRPEGSPIVKQCPNIHTTCDSLQYPNSVPSYRMYSSELVFTLPAHCGKWRFVSKPSTVQPRRDTAFTNIGDNYYYYLETNITNADTNTKNTSAELVNPFPFYAPINEHFSYSLAATDVNGDSLVYHLIPSKNALWQCGFTAPINNIPYVTPFTLQEPFNTGGTFVWDSIHAILSFTAPVAQNPLISLLIDEYRNGVWVGNSMRDIPIVILPVSNPLPQHYAQPTTWVNTQMQGTDSFYVCAGEPMSFCTLLKSANTNAILQSSNTAATIGGANITYLGLLTDSVETCFNWLPTTADTGWHYFTITVRDTTCPTAGVNTPQTFGFSIYVRPETPMIYVNQQVCNQYVWSGTTYTLSGLYTQSFTNIYGCDSMVTLNLNVIHLTNGVTQLGFSLWSNDPGAAYQWINCKNMMPIAGANSQGYSTVVGGDYAVIVSNSGCVDTSDCVTIYSVGTEDISLSNMLSIQPNPANTSLQIKFASKNNYDNLKLAVYDMIGSKVYEYDLIGHQQAYTLDVHQWQVGEYVLKFVSDNHIISTYELSIIR